MAHIRPYFVNFQSAIQGPKISGWTFLAARMELKYPHLVLVYLMDYMNLEPTKGGFAKVFQKFCIWAKSASPNTKMLQLVKREILDPSGGVLYD